MESSDNNYWKIPWVILVVIVVKWNGVGSMKEIWINSTSEELVFVAPFELFQWQSFHIVVGEENHWLQSRYFLNHLEKLEIFYQAEVEIKNTTEIVRYYELVEKYKGQIHYVQYFAFINPGEFLQLSLKVGKFSKHKWLIVTNTSMDEWLRVLENFQLSIDSNIYFVIGWKSKTYEVLEIYKICPNCSMEVHRICAIRKDRLFQEDACYLAKYQRRQNLHGFPLKAIGVTANPFDVKAVQGPNQTWSILGGMWVEIFRIFEKDFNITTTIEILDGYKFGKFDPISKTWDGIIGAVSSGRVDFSLNPISITADRVVYMNFGISVHSAGIRIYIRRSDETSQIHWKFFANPFSRNLLLTIVLSSMFLAISMQLVFKIGPKKDLDFNFSNTCWVMLAALCQKGSHITPASPSAKVIFILAYVTFLIVFAAYSATLTSQLSVPQMMELPFRNLRELVAVKGWRGGPIRGDFTYNVMEKTCPDILASPAKDSSVNTQCELLTQAWKKIVEPGQSNLPSNTAQGLDKTLREKFAFMTTAVGARYILNSEMNDGDACRIHEINKDTLSSNLAIAFRKGFPLRKVFNHHLLKIYQSGTLSRVRRRWIPMRKNCQFQPTDFTQATFFDLAVAPFIVLFGTLLSLFFLILERTRKFTLSSSEENPPLSHHYIKNHKSSNLRLFTLT